MLDYAAARDIGATGTIGNLRGTGSVGVDVVINASEPTARSGSATVAGAP